MEHNEAYIPNITQLLTGFDCLLCLGEPTWPDKLDLHDYWKVDMQHSVDLHTSLLSFLFPGHKTDQYFESNHLIIQKCNFPNTYSFLCNTLLPMMHIFEPDLDFGCMQMA